MILEKGVNYMIKEELLNYIIQSKSIRKYINNINYNFSDYDIAGLITLSNLKYFDKIEELNNIMKNTKDINLKTQLNSYIKYLNWKYIFFKNIKNHIYVYELKKYFVYDDFVTLGYFYNIKDIFIILADYKGKIDKINIVKHRCLNRYSYKYENGIIGEMYIDNNLDISNIEIYSNPDWISDSYLCNISHFWNKYIFIPYPFKKGDKIKTVDNKLCCIFDDISYEESKLFYEDLLSKNCCDINDRKYYIIDYSGTTYHEDILNIEFENEENEE